MKKRIILLLVLAMMLLASCKTYYTEIAWGRDTLFSVEITKKGYYRVWFTHDDVSAYCTASEELGKYAQELLNEHDGEVVFTFNDIEIEDPEAGNWFQTDVCGQGIYNTKVWALLSLMPVEGSSR
jgi:hypothetical protein